ncbi:MAG: hypothetical protein O7G87_03720 [bacterium]|nr:hypothetical protein [bacterium]
MCLLLLLFPLTPPEADPGPTSVRGVSFLAVRALVLLVGLLGCGSEVDNYLTASTGGRIGGSSYLTLPEAGIRRIYFTNNEGGVSVRENNAEFELIPGETSPAFPLLSPNGARLAVVRRGEKPSLSTMSADLADNYLVLPTTEPHAMAWSPDSRRLLFSTTLPPYQLFTADFDDSNRLLLADSEVQIDAAWAPDGRQVVYTGTDGDGVAQVFTVGADGQGRRQITGGERPKSRPSWSSDGTRLTFVSFEAGSGGVYRLAMVDLTRGNGDVVELAFEASLFDQTFPFTEQRWSPFGRFLGFSVFTEKERSRVEFIDMQDQSRWMVTDAKFGDRLVDWSPRRGFLVFARQIEFDWFLVMKRITGEPDSEQFILGPQKWPGYSVEWD